MSAIMTENSATNVGMLTGILTEAGTNEVELFEFIINDQSFGVNVAKVKQILRRQGLNFTRMDFAPPAVSGTMLFRNKPILVVDLRKVLAIECTTSDESRQLVMVTEFNNVTNGFLIDGARRIHRLSWKQFEPMQNLMTSNTPYVNGVVRLEDRLMMVLDLEHIMAEISPETSVAGSSFKLDVFKGTRDRSKIKILFAEDSALIRNHTVKQLDSVGIKNVIVVNDGKIAYERMIELKKKSEQERKPITDYVDIILTDIEMPEMDGLTFCRQLKGILKINLPVIVYSSLINEQMIQKCKACGADAYMGKPQIDKIIAVMDELFKS